MPEKPDFVVERGANPAPEGGWSWHLTEYEVEYVRQFHVRPAREGYEADDPRIEPRLDLEADGVRSDFERAKSRGDARARLVRRPVLVGVLLVVLLGGSAVFATLSVTAVLEVQKLSTEIEELNK